MRTVLKPKNTQKNPLKQKIKNKTISTKIKVKTIVRDVKRKIRGEKHKEQLYDGKSKLQVWYDSLPKRLLPARIDIYDTHVELGREIIVRNIVIGGERDGFPTFPKNMSSKGFEDIMKLGGTKGCKISISESLIKKPGNKSTAELQETYRDVNIEQYKVLMDDPTGTIDLGLKKQKEDIEEKYDDLWDLGENEFMSQTIITIKGTEEEVLWAESNVCIKLESENIQYWIPDDLQFEAWLSSGMFPISDPKFYIQVPSSLAAKLIAMTNINTRYDPRGLYFGIDRETGADVIKDLSKLPAQHLIMYGATGSGKTFTAMELLMRIKDILKRRIIYMTRKRKDELEGAVTDYEAVTKFYGDDGSIIKLEELGFNPFQIIYDEKNMLASDYEYVWDQFRKMIPMFIKSWFKKDYTLNMEGLLEDSIDEFYDKAKIYRNKPESWKDAKWPKMTQLKERCYHIMSDKVGDKFVHSNEDRRTAGAMYRKLRGVKLGGSLGYLLKDTNFKFTDFMAIDLSNIDERLQDPLYLYITSILSLRFNIDSSKNTVIFVDEARAFLRDPEVCNFLLDGITMWRSKGVALWLATQQPADLVKAGVDEEFSNNMFMSIVMGAKMTPKTAKYVKDYFGFPQSVVNDLLTCQQGEGILTIDGESTLIRFEPTPLEDRVIKNKYHIETPTPVGGYRFKPVYYERGMNGENFIEKHGFFMKEMLEVRDDNAIKADGWEKYPVNRATGGRGKTILYYRPGTLDFETMLIKNPEAGTIPGWHNYGKMSIDHLHSVLQMEVFLIENGFNVSANPNNYADLIFEKKMPDGKIHIYAGDYEEAGSHTHDELLKKWGRLQQYDDYRIICPSEDVAAIAASGIPERYIISKGAPFNEWIDSILKDAESITPAGGFNDGYIDSEKNIPDKKQETDDIVPTNTETQNLDITAPCEGTELPITESEM